MGTNTSLAAASTFAAYRNSFSSKANPATNNGTYNIALPNSLPSASGPVGDGFASLTVSTAGRVSGKGTLADGSPVKLTTGQGPGGQVPVYVSLYGGHASLFGWITATSTALESGADMLWWIKPVSVGGP